MRRFREYYRQFEEMPPEEVSLELRARRDEEKRRALSRVVPLDLSGSAWHEPPHPEAVNAATFALRRALNAYPDATATAVREALAERHGVAPDQVVLGHGAGELLRAACGVLLADGGDALVGWPGWQPLPELVEAAGGRAVPVAPTAAEILERAGATTRAVLLSSPADPTGALLSRRALLDLCAGVPEALTVVVDEALGEFDPEGEDAAGLVAELPNLLVVRSFSKAHAMAGLRAGAALGASGLVGRLAPSGGISAPAQAAAAWAVSDRGLEIAARRRAAAAAGHERLAAALAGSPLSALPASVPFAWISSDAEDGPAIAARLASQQVFVAPGRLWRDERHVRAALRGAAAIDRLAGALLDGQAR
jgi:histidinol-phosphate/aromatic aminotransferase/cobyric acid decarboxylase-like protein